MADGASTMTMPARDSSVTVDLRTGLLAGPEVEVSDRTIADLVGFFRDEAARRALDPGARVYRVQVFRPVPEGTEGGLLWGSTFIEPGLVGDEYFMTKGHFHQTRNRGECYITAAGQGALILMDENRRTWFEPMSPGSVHYVPGHVAHRVANTGSDVLSFVACWPSDAGHDYATIAAQGFGARLRRIDGAPRLIEEP
jgi:glucose-6-phosphate isomerase